MANMVSNEAVGDEKSSSSFTYLRCLAPFAQVRPLIIPLRFSFIRFTASKALCFSSFDRPSGLNPAITGLPGIAPSSSCLN